VPRCGRLSCAQLAAQGRRRIQTYHRYAIPARSKRTQVLRLSAALTHRHPLIGGVLHITPPLSLQVALEIDDILRHVERRVLVAPVIPPSVVLVILCGESNHALDEVWEMYRLFVAHRCQELIAVHWKGMVPEVLAILCRGYVLKQGFRAWCRLRKAVTPPHRAHVHSDRRGDHIGVLADKRKFRIYLM